MTLLLLTGQRSFVFQALIFAVLLFSSYSNTSVFLILARVRRVNGHIDIVMDTNLLTLRDKCSQCSGSGFRPARYFKEATYYLP